VLPIGKAQRTEPVLKAEEGKGEIVRRKREGN